MEFVAFKDEAKVLEEMKELYEESFPAVERASMRWIRRQARTQHADLFGIYEKQKFVGFVYLIYHKDLVYIVFFAVARELRGKGYGTKILVALRKKVAGKKLILDIDALSEMAADAEIRVKRKEFYIRNGFVDTEIRVCIYGVDAEVMALGGEIFREDFEGVLKQYLGKARYYAFIKFE